MTGNHHLDNRHHGHRHNTIDHFHRPTTTINHSHNRHRLTTSIVPSRIHDIECRKQFTINAHSSILVGTSRLPLIHPLTHTSTASLINTGLPKDHSPQFIQREHQSIQTTESREYLSEIDHQTDKMAPK